MSKNGRSHRHSEIRDSPNEFLKAPEHRRRIPPNSVFCTNPCVSRLSGNRAPRRRSPTGARNASAQAVTALGRPRRPLFPLRFAKATRKGLAVTPDLSVLAALSTGLHLAVARA
jgi:hypothetical protein